MTSRIFQAVGLGFSDGMSSAPSLTVKGEFSIAERIIEVARRTGVPVVEREDLCRALSELPLDTKIPEELYAAAAALLQEIGALRLMKEPER